MTRKSEKEQTSRKKQAKQDNVPKPIKSTVSKVFSKVTNSILNQCDNTKKTFKNTVEKEAEKKNQEQTNGKADLIPQENERILKGAHKSFVATELPKADIDNYFDQAKPYIKALTKGSVKEVQSL